MKNKHKCIYCSAIKEDIAWLSQPELSSSCINSNLNGTLPIGDNKRHEGISAKIKDYGHLIGTDENDSGYMKYIQENPGSLEIRSEYIGDKLFPTFQKCPLIIEISIHYCPICGRKLGINSKDI